MQSLTNVGKSTNPTCIRGVVNRTNRTDQTEQNRHIMFVSPQGTCTSFRRPGSPRYSYRRLWAFGMSHTYLLDVGLLHNIYAYMYKV